MLKRPRAALSTTLLAAALLSLSLPARAESLPAYPFIHVSGGAYQEVQPDIGALDFEIMAGDADPAAARAVLEARLGEVSALLKQLGIAPEDMAVREVRQSLAKRQPAGGGPVYELRCEVHINVRELSNWAALAGGLLGKPNLDGFAASFDLSTMEQLHDQLVTRAIVDARRRAGVMAGADGRRAGAITALSSQEMKNLTTSMGLQRSEFRPQQRNQSNARPQTERDQLLTIEPLKLSQMVDAIFRLEDAAPARRTR